MTVGYFLLLTPVFFNFFSSCWGKTCDVVFVLATRRAKVKRRQGIRLLWISDMTLCAGGFGRSGEDTQSSPRHQRRRRCPSGRGSLAGMWRSHGWEEVLPVYTLGQVCFFLSCTIKLSPALLVVFLWPEVAWIFKPLHNPGDHSQAVAALRGAGEVCAVRIQLFSQGEPTLWKLLVVMWVLVFCRSPAPVLMGDVCGVTGHNHTTLYKPETFVGCVFLLFKKIWGAAGWKNQWMRLIYILNVSK